jgi:hypothetical protein
LSSEQIQIIDDIRFKLSKNSVYLGQLHTPTVLKTLLKAGLENLRKNKHQEPPKTQSIFADDPQSVSLEELKGDDDPAQSSDSYEITN